MDKRDFRKLDAVTQAELRRVAVRMVQAGKTRREAATAVEVNPRLILSANSGGLCQGSETCHARFGAWRSSQPVHNT